MFRDKTVTREIVIDLTGPDGNAWSLLAYAHRLANQLNLPSEKIISEMKEGDYEHLLQTFDKYFGDYVILER